MKKYHYGESTPLLIDKDNTAGSSSTTFMEDVNDFFRRLPTRYIGVGAGALIISCISILMLHSMHREITFNSQQQLTASVLAVSQNNANESFKSEKNEPEIADNIVEIPLGKLIPVRRISRDGRNFFAFYKIPYARPPLKELRFEPPKVVDAWDDIRKETEVAPQCIQKVKHSVGNVTSGEENCLFLNLYTTHIPKLQDNVTNENLTALMPTLVYIHGGGLLSGNGSRYGPDYFMDEDVVLITFQFRLGPFGFLNIGDNGNMGYKDQVMLLKWVKDYIKYFGGDPERVTIFGNSSGAAAVGLHLLSPMSKGLFHKAIFQSSSTISGNTVDSNPELTVEAIGRETGCTTSSTRRLINCLRDVNASSLALIQGGDIKYQATIEKSVETENSFLTDYPLNILKSGKINEATVIIGINSAEMVSQSLVMLKSPSLIETINENWTDIAPKLLNYHSSAFDPDEMSFAIRQFYFGDHELDNDTMSNMTNLFSDRSVVHPSYLEALYHSTINDVYLYYLTKEPAKSYADKAKEGFPPGYYYGVSHADELQFMFPYWGYPEIPIQSKHYNFSKMLVKMWSNFAANGIPSQDWTPIKRENNSIEWCALDDQPEMTDALLTRMKFWDQYSPADLNYQ